MGRVKFLKDRRKKQKFHSRGKLVKPRAAFARREVSFTKEFLFALNTIEIMAQSAFAAR